jgi:hypothetical protein
MKMEILIAIINFAWLWVCLAPAMLLLAIVLIKWAKSNVATSNHESSKHRHNWEDVTDNNDPNYKTEILDSWYAKYHYKWRCTECDEEHDESKTAFL